MLLKRVKITVPTKFRLRGRNKGSKKLRHCVYTIVNQIFVLETSLEDIKKGDNFADSTVCMVDNCANTHIWNCKDDFIPGSLQSISRMSSVATIGGSNFYPDSVGKLPVTWNDGKGGSYSIVLDNVLYFPHSPVNVMSITRLADQLDDDVGTYVKTLRKSSIFAWKNESGLLELKHGSCGLPELVVNEVQDPSIFGSALNVYHTRETCTNATVLPEDVVDTTAPGVVPKYAVMFNKANLDPEMLKTDAYSSPYTSSNPFKHTKYKVGDCLRFVKDDHSELCTVKSVRMKKLNFPMEYEVLLDSSDTSLYVTKDSLKPLEASDVSDVNLSDGQLHDLSTALNQWKSDAASWSGPIECPLMREFKGWHHRLNHLSFEKMFKLCEAGVLPKKFLRLKGQLLLCPSCVISKMKRKPWRFKGGDSHIRKPNEAFPGGCVSVDHMESQQSGLLPKQNGRHGLARITGASVYVDNDSEFVYSHFQTSLDLDQTIASKQAFEAVADSYDVKVKSYLADNGIFAKNAFKQAVANDNQSIRFCAVSAHNQNGIVERKIGLMTNDARTLLIHAQRHWPEMISTVLWPYAWKAVEYRNNVFGLNRNGKHPAQAFGGFHLPFNAQLRDQHTWGCPVYVLESKAADGMIPKWNPKARVGVYLGHSPSYAGTVALVLNPRTLHVSPQYHVVFDDDFSTVPYMRKSEMPPNWTELVTSSRERATDEDFELATRWSVDSTLNEDVENEPDDSLAALNEGEYHVAPALSGNEGDRNISRSNDEVLDETRERNEFDFSSGSNDVSSDSVVPTTDITSSPRRSPVRVPVENYSSMHDMPQLADLNDLSRRKSSRTPKPSEKAKASSDKTVKKLFGLACLFPMVYFGALSGELINRGGSSVVAKAVYHAERIKSQFDGTINTLHHAFLSTVDNGTYTLKEMLQQSDKAEFIKAMQVEVSDHESRGHWSLMKRSEMPEGTKTILAIWSFKRKLYPDGSINKYKARLCAHGGMQTWGENFWETYAPVVNWLSVRILFALSIIHDLDTRSIDFVLAFPQAPLDIDVFMELPYGFAVDGITDENSKGYVLKLNKSLYGLKQAAYNWFEMLSKGLRDRGFKASETDPCVFLRKDCIVLCYVDDCILITKRNTKVADDLVDSLMNGHENFKLEDEGPLCRYLGVIVDRDKDGSIHMYQPNLVKRFLGLVCIEEHEKSKDTPIVKPMLHRDLDGPPRRYAWNYRQAVGMLGYLQGSTRPDIATAVHQCARFCNEPRLSHERAIRRIGKYLQGNKDKGLIFRPDPRLGLECFVDADFAGNWNQADPDNAENAMSRTGYTVRYAGCSAHWSSKLQTEIALSTAEAEYIALSQALREVIPTMCFLEELKPVIDLYVPTPRVHCKVFEDNTACIAMASAKKFSPRTKHIALKYHHFRSAVNEGKIKIFHVDTNEQIADIFTKPLKIDQFRYLRQKLMGW